MEQVSHAPHDLQGPRQQPTRNAVNDELPQCDQKRDEKDRAKSGKQFQNRMGTSIFDIAAREDPFYERMLRKSDRTETSEQNTIVSSGDSIIENN